MSDESLPWMGPSLGAAVRHIGLEHNSPPSSATAVVWRFGKPISGRMRSCGQYEVRRSRYRRMARLISSCPGRRND
jgi:hypothetical protein